ncbi:hypothetical protein A3J19_04260 [Candidatus Daviesbacteria bacterium RIFCSPLOWO2_02_FULL_41_8]|uniref:Uncharacterized protein n=3 Tax=Candidatus Daviesiibacteriota TaxID=1752718 RepID=A0A1F5NLL0_9BACT|nr:MAG: hypothetical protein A2871_00690 [Candidatus Daviesbacteria bacterium RIFCSPHIGHO2_01_FULL_41_23]OGE33422.1 MAG: hypothetical protein A3D83_00300 [Candidatus Daviesbacteria bacterium RIFCSPHIGHO2_02_FULL_41_10]OGE62412.1 MAG: hypothetical protein A2967_01180 [Candidatus Daviesbacteria bacterium RIFCSPLOWO2_01_FULL_41_32]OGE78559.1 MAG: hypothetical protein A3J19_04260 [Candidatus Daviesbacteria bacterium RIFCSPLOWO2_02_FULL_41_8]
MVFWIILFLLIVGISFVLAFRSMQDYQEIPETKSVDYGLFLIRQTEQFTASVLDSIGGLLLDAGLIISIERLFKGTQAALTIYGPKMILVKFAPVLNLLELEDYALGFNTGDVSIWEVGSKDQKKHPEGPNNIFQNLSQLGQDDHFCWQVVLGPRKEKGNITFKTQIRALVYSRVPEKKKMLASMLGELKVGELTKIPKPFSTEQMMDFYKIRSLSKDSNGPVLDSAGVINLLKV